jgi:hypothetical protein
MADDGRYVGVSDSAPNGRVDEVGEKGNPIIE